MVSSNLKRRLRRVLHAAPRPLAGRERRPEPQDFSIPLLRSYRLVHAFALRRAKAAPEHLAHLRACVESRAAHLWAAEEELELALQAARRAMDAGNDDEWMAQVILARECVTRIAGHSSGLIHVMLDHVAHRSALPDDNQA